MWITGSSECHQLYSGKINQILMMNALLIYSTVANEGGGIDRENPEIESFSTPLNTSDEKLFLLSSVLMKNTLETLLDALQSPTTSGLLGCISAHFISKLLSFVELLLILLKE